MGIANLHDGTLAPTAHLSHKGRPAPLHKLLDRRHLAQVREVVSETVRVVLAPQPRRPIGGLQSEGVPIPVLLRDGSIAPLQVSVVWKAC